MRRTPQTSELSWLVRSPIAHRGLHGLPTACVENTETAFSKAMAYGYAIECDVQLSADGEAVVFHDGSVDRMMEGTGRVADSSVRTLKSLAYRDGSDRMQTLSELLMQVRGLVPLIVEIKSLWDGNMGLAQRVLDVVEHYDGPLALMSFDPDVVADLAINGERHVRGIVADRVHDPYYAPLSIARRLELRRFSHLARTQPHFVSFDQAGLPFTPVQQIRTQGFPVIAWTITSEEEASRARRYCDQITFEEFLPA